MNFETYNTIPNIDSTNNKFYFDDNDEEITIPIGTYELQALARYLKNAILRIRNINEDDIKGERSIVLQANENTMKCELRCAYRINFEKPNNIGSVLGFLSRILEPDLWYESDQPVNIMTSEYKYHSRGM